MISLIVLDTETGGLDPDKHCIIELAARLVHIDNRSLRVTLKVFHTYIQPDRPVDPAAAEVNGYNKHFWNRKAVRPKHAFTGFVNWLNALCEIDHVNQCSHELEGLIWAGSNVLGFDLPFLRSDMARVGLELPGKPKMTRRTLNTESLCFPLFVSGQVEGCGIADLRKWAGCEGEQAHRAIDDIDDTIKVIDAYLRSIFVIDEYNKKRNEIKRELKC